MRLAGGKSSRRTPDLDPPVRDPKERTVRPMAEAAKARNWIDFARAGVGAGALTSVALVPPEGVVGPHVETLTWQGLTLAAATVAQMVRFAGRLSLFAPIFFLQGVTFAVAGWLVGGLSMVGSWALTPVLPGAGAVLFVQGGLALSLGLLMRDTEPTMLMVLAGVVWVPVLASVLLKKRLSAAFDKRVKVVSRGSRSRREAAKDARVGS